MSSYDGVPPLEDSDDAPEHSNDANYDEIEACMNIYGGVIDFTVRWGHGEFDSESIGKQLLRWFTLLCKLFGAYLSQVTIMLFLGDIIESSMKKDPDSLSTKRFDNTKAGLFLGIFAMAVFGALANWSLHMRIVTVGQYIKQQRGAEPQEIEALPRPVKLILLILVLIPEFAVFAGVLFRGSEYLLVSPDLETLILNSTALVFLTEIGNYIYVATAMPPKHLKMRVNRKNVSAQKVRDGAFNLLVLLLVGNWEYIMRGWILLREIGSPELILIVKIFVLLILLVMILFLGDLQKQAAFVVAGSFFFALLAALCVGFTELVRVSQEHWPSSLYVGLGLLVISFCICPGIGWSANNVPAGFVFGCYFSLFVSVCLSSFFFLVSVGHHIARVQSADVQPTYPIVGPGVWNAEKDGSCAEGLVPCELDSSLCIESKFVTETFRGIPLYSTLYGQNCPAMKSEYNCSRLGFHNKAGFDFAGCHAKEVQDRAATYFEAKERCGNQGARLCTLLELGLAYHDISTDNLPKKSWTGVPCFHDQNLKIQGPKGKEYVRYQSSSVGYWNHVLNGTPVCSIVQDQAAVICCADTSLTCNVHTGGTCKWSSCAEYRGPTTCSAGKCLCESGYCADEHGVCNRHKEGFLKDLLKKKGLQHENVEGSKRTHRKLTHANSDSVQEWAEILAFIEENIGIEHPKALKKDVLVRMVLSSSRSSHHAESLLIAWRSFKLGHGQESILLKHLHAIMQDYQEP